MRRLFVGNFDFEHVLAGRPPAQAAGRLARINAELASSWLAIAADGDRVWTPAPIDAFLQAASDQGLPRVVGVADLAAVCEPDLELVPWGWTASLRQLGERAGWRMDPPPQCSVQTANSRSFSFGLECEWGIALPGAAVVTSIDELEAAVCRLPAGQREWVLKAEYGMSARERILDRNTPTPSTLRWAARRLERRPLYFEPWVDAVVELGIQIDVPSRNEPVLLGVTPLLTDSAGRYRGNRFTASTSEQQSWQPAVEVAIRAARRVQQLGYFGPLGIDAMLYRDWDGNFRWRPLQDLNARWTMGRLSLGWRRFLRPEETYGAWLHFPRGRRPALPPASRWIPTTPAVVGGSPTRHDSLVAFAGQ